MGLVRLNRIKPFYDYVLFVSVPLRHRQSSALMGQATRLDSPEDQPLDSAKGQRPLDPVSDAAAHPAGQGSGLLDRLAVFDRDLAADTLGKKLERFG